MSALQFLENLRVRAPELAEGSLTLADLYSKKLYHQLTEAILEFIRLPSLSGNGEVLFHFYQAFVLDVSKKIDKLTLSQIAYFVAERLPAADATKMLTELHETLKNDLQSDIYLASASATFLVQINQEKAKEKLDELQAKISSVTGLEPIVYAQFYHLCLKYYELRGDFEKYYENGIIYLSYTDLDAINEEQKKSFSQQLALSCLLGRSNFNFGELLQSQIAPLLKASNNTLYSLIETFNKGDVKLFEKQFEESGKSIELLSKNRGLLEEKIRVAAFLELAFSINPSNRFVTFEQISNAALVPKSEVELLVMRAQSMGLVKGKINQPQERVQITWIIPRTLNKEQVGVLAHQFEEWAQIVAAAIRDVRSLNATNDLKIE